MECASCLSPEFKLYIIKDYQRLKTYDWHRVALEWNAKRELSKVNYRIHTDAIKDYLLPQHLTPQQINFTYASEADILNMALFGMTAKQWRTQHPDATGNMRDHADIYQLIVPLNLYIMNAELIKQGTSPCGRLTSLTNMAIEQTCSPLTISAVQRLNAAISGSSSLPGTLAH